MKNNILDKPLTLEEAREKAEKYAKENGLKLGKLRSSNYFGDMVIDESYVFEADDPEDDGLIVGLPLYITVSKNIDWVAQGRFMLNE